MCWLMAISIHALREEGDLSRCLSTASLNIFLSTPSARRATALPVAIEGAPKFLSTPSARRATSKLGGAALAVIISIHALREEGDILRHRQPHTSRYFYPRPPRGGRHMTAFGPNRRKLFLSTPSARRATKYCQSGRIGVIFLSTPSARRATRASQRYRGRRPISIHALREEGDSYRLTPTLPLKISIHALREEGDQELDATSRTPRISIHALREEGDLASLPLLQIQTYFYPRPPRGGRPRLNSTVLLYVEFLSTPSARRATERRADYAAHE